MIQIFLKVFFVASFLLSVISYGQLSNVGDKTAEFKYISPKPDSWNIMPENNIALRYGDNIEAKSLDNFNIEVIGSLSGKINGEVKLSTDGKTLLFNPDKPFQFAEKIQVETSGMVKTKKGIKIHPVSFCFYVTEKIPELPKDYSWKEELKFHQSFIINNSNTYAPQIKRVKDNNLPEDFPELTVEVLNNPSGEGYYFIAPFGYWGWFPDATPYLIIYDTTAIPVFYRRLDNDAYDFKLNENGLLSYYYNSWPEVKNHVLDKSFNIIDEYSMQNGYGTDFHEFLMLENGHVFVMGYDPQIVDMSQYVTGGVEDAIVIGWVIQELDTEKNVVFQWSSWDHYDILDGEGYVDLTSSNIDLVHGNAIGISPDNTLLLSSRNLNEVTKIDRNTGEIIWRLEGNNNMFDFIDDTLNFSRQHDCRILDNGNLSLFDNGSDNPEPQFSSMIEYELDEENFTATLKRRLRSSPDIFGTIMGNAQETENGNIVTGWGSGVPGITEFNTNGEIVAEYYFESINYRGYRYPFSTTYFELSENSLNYGYIWQEDQLTKDIEVFNNQEVDIEITNHFLLTDIFLLENELPITIPAGGSANVQVTFNPSVIGSYTDVLTLNSDINTNELVQRIAQQVRLVGHATEGQNTGDFIEATKVIIYPNPTDKDLIIEFSQKHFSGTVQLYDVYGRIVITQTFDEIPTIELNLEQLPGGVYFVYLTEQHDSGNQFYKIIKN